MFTRCPNCNAIFEVTERQLSVHEGLVRCGVCKHVFNAKWFLLDSEDEEFSRQSPKLDRVDVDVGAAKESNGLSESVEREIPPTIPEELLGEIGFREEPVLSPVEEALLDVRGFSRDFRQGESKGVSPRAGPADQDVPLQSYGSDESLPPAGPRDSDEEVARPALLGQPPTGDTGALLDQERMEQLEADRELDEPSLGARSAPVLEAEKEPGSPRVGRLPAEGDAPISVRSVDPYLKQRASPLATLLWSVAVLFFLFLLLLQVRTFHIEALASNDVLRPYVAGFCRIAACELPPRSDPAYFSITHTRIALHPTEPGALRISVNLINEAEFAQPYPGLQLTLTDHVGRIVGRRNFRPVEFLASSEENLLPPRTLGKVVLDLAHPHEQAVGFEVDVVNAE